MWKTWLMEAQPAQRGPLFARPSVKDTESSQLV